MSSPEPSGDRYFSIFEHADDLIVSCRLDGTITDVNRATERTVGWSRDELIGQSVDRIVTPASRAIGDERVRRALAGEKLPKIFELEKRLLFDAGANYVGHELMVPKVGDYHTLAHTDHSKVLVRNENGVELLSNVCRHRQAIMLQGRGNTQNIVCPLHRWTYDLKGELLGAPHFAESPCVKLRSAPLKRWNGLLFAGPRDPAQDLARISTAADSGAFSTYTAVTLSLPPAAFAASIRPRTTACGLPLCSPAMRAMAVESTRSLRPSLHSSSASPGSKAISWSSTNSASSGVCGSEPTSR